MDKKSSSVLSSYMRLKKLRPNIWSTTKHGWLAIWRSAGEAIIKIGLNPPPTHSVSEWVQEVSWDLKEFMASHDNEPLKENMRKETKRSFEIWIDLN